MPNMKGATSDKPTLPLRKKLHLCTEEKKLIPFKNFLEASAFSLLKLQHLRNKDSMIKRL